MNKLVSIITPCYNGENYLHRFLDSVLAQTYDNFEFIIINDGSTDSTGKILNSYIEPFSSKGIKYIIINQENKGQSEAINQGLKIFKGDYLSWVDSDDILYPKYIESKVTFLEKNTDCGLVISQTSIVNENNLSKEIAIRQRKKPKGKDTLFEDLIIGKNAPVISGAYMLRSSCFLDVNPSRSILSPREWGQNYQLLIPISYKYKCGYLEEVLYTYVMRQDSHWHTILILPFEEAKKRFDVGRYILRNIIESMNIPNKSYYMKLIEWRYIHWLMEISARYKNLPLLKEQIEKLKEMDMCTLNDLIFYWKERFLIVKFFWRLGKKYSILLRIMSRIKKIIATLIFYRHLKRGISSCRYALQQLITKYNYARKLKSLQSKKEINVAFLVSENAKWNGTSLYRKLTANPRFNPMVLVIVPKNTNSEDNVDFLFFKQRGYNVFAITNFVDMNKHKPDIIFYQQPWFALGLRNDFSPFKISKCALCLYFPYGIATTIEIPRRWNSCKYFFRMLYRQFLFNLDCVKQYESRGVHNIIATGHPQLDAYAEPVKNNPWRDLTKVKIIYAPHHSFQIKFTGMTLATFAWNGKRLLQMAKDNPHTEWIFKPHPVFRKTVIRDGIMTEEETSEYYDEWAQIGQIYDKGDYFDIFRTSDLMITDCDGFLTEYLPTGNPVIHLIPSDNNVIWSSTSQKSSRHYYKVRNLAELEQTFDMLVKRREDPLKAERLKDAAEITFNAAENIYNELLKIIGKQ